MLSNLRKMSSEARAIVGKVQTVIEHKLTSTFKPTFLQVINESYMHSVPKGSETHFKVVVVSDSFVNKGLLDRHRMVNTTLADELTNGVHALSIVAKTPEQWQQTPAVSPSPACMGGFGH